MKWPFGLFAAGAGSAILLLELCDSAHSCVVWLAGCPPGRLVAGGRGETLLLTWPLLGRHVRWAASNAANRLAGPWEPRPALLG